MKTDGTDAAIREFLRKADRAYSEHESGYANADATLRRLQDHIRQLETAVEDETEERLLR